MKLILFVVVSTIMFIGCSKDNNESQKRKEIVVSNVELIKYSKEKVKEKPPRKRVQKRVEIIKKVEVKKKKKKSAVKKKSLLVQKLYVDVSTGLMWQNSNDTKSVSKNWDDSKSYCAKLKLNKFNDWRLPDFNELLSIVEYENYNCAVKSGFKKVEPKLYWSASNNSANTSKAWCVHFKDGTTKYGNKSSLHYIRCVRDSSKAGT